MSASARSTTDDLANANDGVSMTGLQLSTRQRIVNEADRLFYQHGYEHTSFANIAAAVQLSRGNFYHHFKTKDEILDAVIVLRIEKTRSMLDAWASGAETPLTSIEQFVQMLLMNRRQIRKHGCPVGTLCAELAKLDHPALPQANQLFTLFRDWLSKQFAALGNVKNADQLAMHLLARSQGIATLANAFNDETLIQQEVQQLLEWLRTISDLPRHKKGA